MINTGMSNFYTKTFLPCDYVRHFEDGTDAEVTKTSQVVA